MRDRLVLPLVLAGALGTAPGGAAAQEVVEAEREETPAGKPSTGRLAVSAKYGSTGPAADLTYGWSRELHGRLTLSYEPHPDRGEKDTIRATVALLLDWHPGGRAFRLSGGLAYLHTESFDAPAGSRSFGSNEVVPYFGIGWGNPLATGSRWRFVVDLGAFGGGGSSDRTVSDSARASTSSAREDGSGGLTVRFSWRPVVSTGISFRF